MTEDRRAMLPAFDYYGNLPLGIHRARAEEVIERFANGSPERAALGQELREFFEWSRRAGVRRLILSGAFVTDQLAPDTVGVIILPRDDLPRGEPPFNEQQFLWRSVRADWALDDDELEHLALTDQKMHDYQRLEGVVEVVLQA